MTLKQRAILHTAGILAAIVGGSVGITLILQNLNAEQITNGFAILSIALLIYSMYGVVLSRLEYDEKLKDITKNNPTLR
jgi:uncharacterized membrane protein YfcA